MTAASSKPSLVLLVSSLGVGGAERHMVTLANELADRYDLDLVYLKPADALLKDVDGDRVRSVTCLDVRFKLDPGALGRLSRIFDARQTQLVLCANMYPLLYAQLASVLARRRPALVEVFHTTVMRGWRDRLQMALYRPLLRFGTHFVFISDAQREFWTRRGLRAGAVHRIHNGIDADRFDPAPYADGVETIRADLGFTPADYVVGICAILRPEKAHHHLLEAVARLRDEGLGWKVLIIGDGPLRGDIERDIARRGLANDVRITGMIDDVRPLVAACDAMALVSVAIETFSIAALESMALAKPMLISDIGGAREQVEDGVHGAIFPPGDVDTLTASLRRLRDHDQLRAMGLAARERVCRSFTLTAMIDQYDGLLRDVLENR